MEWTIIKYIENPLSCRESDIGKALPASTKRDWSCLRVKKGLWAPNFLETGNRLRKLSHQETRYKFQHPLQKLIRKVIEKNVSEYRARTSAGQWTRDPLNPTALSWPPFPKFIKKHVLLPWQGNLAHFPKRISELPRTRFPLSNGDVYCDYPVPVMPLNIVWVWGKGWANNLSF